MTASKADWLTPQGFVHGERLREQDGRSRAPVALPIAPEAREGHARPARLHRPTSTAAAANAT